MPEQVPHPSRGRKRARLEWIIRYHQLDVDEPSRKRAEKCILHYELEAITESEAAFLRAIGRDAQRASLPYFFGTLHRIQQQKDTERHQEHCRQRYEYQRLREREGRQSHERDESPTVVPVVAQQEAVILKRAKDYPYPK